MTRPFGTAPSDYWTTAQALGWSDDNKLAGLYLLINPHNTATGTYRLPDGYACEDLGWTIERFAQALANPSGNGFVNRCQSTKWVWIPDQLERHPLANPNQRTAARRQVQAIPQACGWRAAFFQRYGEHLGFDAEQIAQLCATVPETVPRTVGEASAQPFANMEMESRGEREMELDLSAEQPAAVVAKVSKGGKAKAPPAVTKPTLQAYCQAWTGRYGEEPVLAQPKVNGQLSQFVKTVGPELAPLVADFYVRSTDAFALRRRHPVDLLVTDVTRWVQEFREAQGTATTAGTGWEGHTL